jgi:hypothetical protein
MPLDGSELFANPTIAKLWEVECLLATEDQWCKGRLHDRKGRHCLVGAISEVNARQELTRPLIRAIKEVSGKHYWRIESYNDDPNTNHQDVLRVLHSARLLVIEDIARANEPKPWHMKIREFMNEIFSVTGGQSGLAGAGSSAIQVPVRITEPSRPDKYREALGETVDILQ